MSAKRITPMTFSPFHPIRRIVCFIAACGARSALMISLLVPFTALRPAVAQSGAADVLVLSNGDTLHGKLVNSSGGKITFHSDALGDISVDWDKIKELHTSGSYAVLDKSVKLR